MEITQKYNEIKIKMRMKPNSVFSIFKNNNEKQRVCITCYDKLKSLDEIEGQYMGLMKFSAEGIKQIKGIFHAAVNNGELLGKDIENSYMTDLLQSVINSGRPVTAVPVHGGWVEVDTVDDLESSTTKNRINSIV